MAEYYLQAEKVESGVRSAGKIIKIIPDLTKAIVVFDTEYVNVVRCKDCKHYKQSEVADRKMCFRKDVDGVQVCYDFLPNDSCTYGERKESEE